jgi:hypothetical protein
MQYRVRCNFLSVLTLSNFVSLIEFLGRALQTLTSVCFWKTYLQNLLKMFFHCAVFYSLRQTFPEVIESCEVNSRFNVEVFCGNFVRYGRIKTAFLRPVYKNSQGSCLKSVSYINRVCGKFL